MCNKSADPSFDFLAQNEHPKNVSSIANINMYLQYLEVFVFALFLFAIAIGSLV